MAKITIQIPVAWLEKHKNQALEAHKEWCIENGDTDYKKYPAYLLEDLNFNVTDGLEFDDGLASAMGDAGYGNATDVFISVRDVKVEERTLIQIFEWISKTANRIRALLQALPEKQE